MSTAPRSPKIKDIYRQACRLGLKIQSSAAGVEKIQLQDRLRCLKDDLHAEAHAAAVADERQRCLELYNLSRSNIDLRRGHQDGSFLNFLQDGSDVRSAAAVLTAIRQEATTDYACIEEV